MQRVTLGLHRPERLGFMADFFAEKKEEPMTPERLGELATSEKLADRLIAAKAKETPPLILQRLAYNDKDSMVRKAAMANKQTPLLF